MAGIKDVAKRAGVGVGTVSRMLNDSGYVAGETREKIEIAMRELNYTPNLQHGQGEQCGAGISGYAEPSHRGRRDYRGAFSGCGGVSEDPQAYRSAGQISRRAYPGGGGKS